ncbi:MAG: hypothetical protein ABI167_11310 [Nitrosospira sp.]
MSDPDYSGFQNPLSAYGGKYLLPLAATAAVGSLVYGLASKGSTPPARLDRPLAVAKAKTMINRFRGQAGRGKWPGLDRTGVADRLELLLDSPHLVNQGGNGLCGEAAFLYVWLSEDPWSVARYCVQLYNGGAASVGTDVWVRPRESLKSQDFTKIAKMMVDRNSADKDAIKWGAEWMMMSALRDANNFIISYDGTPSDDWGSGSSNGEVADWLRATGVFKDVSEADGRGSKNNFAAAAKLDPQTSVVILSIDSRMFKETVIGPGNDTHNAVLKSPIVVTEDGTVDFDVWTWGNPVGPVSALRATYHQPELSPAQFTAEFFGAVVATR